MSARPLSLALSAGLLMSLGLAACSGGGDSTSAPSALGGELKNGNVQLDLGGPVTSYDPVKGASFQDSVVMTALYEPLVTFKQGGGVLPVLADKWTTTPNSATFTLKSGVTCSDGTALSPEIVKRSLERFLDPKTGSSQRGVAIGTGNVATVTTGADSVTVTLKNPYSNLLEGLALPYSGIVCPAGLDNPASLATTSAGTGPYVSQTQVAGQSYTLTHRKDHTWGATYPGTPTKGSAPTSLTFKVVADDNTRANLLTSGDLDIASFTSKAVDKFDKTANVKVEVSQQSDTMLVFNERPGHATSDPAVRKAIAQAIDRSALNEVQSYGRGKLLTQMGQDDYKCADAGLKSLIPATDLAAAKTVLQGKKVKVMGTNLLAGGEANNYLLATLRAAGADASVENLNNQEWVSNLFGGTHDWDVSVLVYSNPASSLIAAGAFFTGKAAPAGQNVGAVTDEKASTLQVSAGQDSGCDSVTAMQRELMTDTDVLPLATAPVSVAFGRGTWAYLRKGLVQVPSLRVGVE